MREVSTEAEDLLVNLVAWEMLGRDDFDPKMLLRKLSLSDLFTIQTNILGTPETKKFVSVQMVELEVQYRRGKLQCDWSYERNGECVRLYYLPLAGKEAATRELRLMA